MSSHPSDVTLTTCTASRVGVRTSKGSPLKDPLTIRRITTPSLLKPRRSPKKNLDRAKAAPGSVGVSVADSSEQPHKRDLRMVAPAHQSIRPWKHRPTHLDPHALGGHVDFEHQVFGDEWCDATRFLHGMKLFASHRYVLGGLVDHDRGGVGQSVYCTDSQLCATHRNQDPWRSRQGALRLLRQISWIVTAS